MPLLPVLLVASAVAGLLVGSFLNVVIHRVPRGQSIVRPGSHCPACGHAVRARHNVPVLSWLLLRGRCADCRTPISARYPAVELATGLLFVAVTDQLARLDRLEALPAYLFFTSVGIALTAIDLDVLRLPNAIVYPAYVGMASLLATASVFEGTAAPLVRAGVGASVLLAFYLTLVLVRPGGMGLGDAKLAGVVGGALGFLSYPALLVGAFAAFVIGGLAGVALLASRRAGMRSAVPFGPAMIAGALLAIFVGAPISHAYAHLLVPA